MREPTRPLVLLRVDFRGQKVAYEIEPVELDLPRLGQNLWRVDLPGTKYLSPRRLRVWRFPGGVTSIGKDLADANRRLYEFLAAERQAER